MKRFLLPALAVILALLFAWGGESRQREVGRLLGADLSGARVLEDYDSHGGFHGDGCTYAVLQLREGSGPLPPDREELPLPWELEAAVYGAARQEGDAVSEWGPVLAGMPPVHPIRRGWYWFYDCNAEDAPHDSGQLWERGSFNFVLVMWDADTDRLYYIKVDT